MEGRAPIPKGGHQSIIWLSCPKTTEKMGRGRGSAADIIRLVVISRVTLDTNRYSSQL